MSDWTETLDQIGEQLLWYSLICLAIAVLIIAYFWLFPPQNDPENSELRKSLRLIYAGFVKGWHEGLRGYFAPLRPAPWRAAWRALQSPEANWTSPFRAWLQEINRIMKG